MEPPQKGDDEDDEQEQLNCERDEDKEIDQHEVDDDVFFCLQACLTHTFVSELLLAVADSVKNGLIR